MKLEARFYLRWVLCFLGFGMQIAYAMELSEGNKVSNESFVYKNGKNKSKSPLTADVDCKVYPEFIDSCESEFSSLSVIAPSTHSSQEDDSPLYNGESSSQVDYSALKRKSVLAQSARSIQAVSLSKILLPIQRGVPQATPMSEIEPSVVRYLLLSNDSSLDNVRRNDPGDSDSGADGCCCEDADGCLVCCVPLIGIPLAGIGLLWLKKAMDPVQ